ncbi:primosomal protein N' [soil metagenome]
MNICSTPDPSYVEVAVDARLSDRRATLTYRVPGEFRGEIDVGQLVWAPLRKDLTLGIVVEWTQPPAHDFYRVRDLHAPVEPAFRLSEIQWRLATWMAEETICSLYEAASPMLPPGVASRAVEYLELVRSPEDDERQRLTPMQRKLVERLETNQSMSLSAARSAMDSSLTTIIPALEERRLIRRVARVRHRRPDTSGLVEQVRLLDHAGPPPERAFRQVEAYEWLLPRLRARPDRTLKLDTVLASDAVANRSILQALADRGVIAIETRPLQVEEPGRHRFVDLTQQQTAVWREIVDGIAADPTQGFLLHGVTGSGKTEVYFRLIAEVLESGKSAILLVPEISLAGQVIERATARFGDRALVLHSALDDRTRYDNWLKARSGEPVVVVGPRSALFAPVPEVGVIIVDEEHETAYKQETLPRYHARTVARRLSRLHRASLILGSATPDVESTYRAAKGSWKRLNLTERVGQRAVDRFGGVGPMTIPMPDVELLDMRTELRAGNASLFSERLRELMKQRLESGEQTILFLNRRGMSTFIQCRSCGAVSECPFCDIPMVYHRAGERLVCHRCGYRVPPVLRCVECGSTSVGYFGTGTQRVEQEVGGLFPGARVLRWDQDALRGGVSHEVLLDRVQRHVVDIVVGTQMIGRGLDLANVTLVGVVNADTYLHLPDFRAAERTFQMLVQVAGRAGRRAAGGQVVIQTYSPDHYALSSAAGQSYERFYREEIAFRAKHGHPPFKRLVRLLVRDRDNETAEQRALDFAGEIEQYVLEHAEAQGVDLLGPAPAFAVRVRGQYGWQILLRGDAAPRVMGAIRIPPGWIIDVDPVSLL